MQKAAAEKKTANSSTRIQANLLLIGKINLRPPLKILLPTKVDALRVLATVHFKQRYLTANTICQYPSKR